MKVQARSRREQIRTMLADLKLPGSLEAVDEVRTNGRNHLGDTFSNRAKTRQNVS